MAANTVPESLDGLNYANWSVCMKNYLLANDLWDIVEATTEAPSPEEAEAEYKAWIKKNAAALHAIQNHACRIYFPRLRKSVQQGFVGMLWLKCMRYSRTEGHVYVQFRSLHKAIESGDLNSVRDFLHFHPNAVNKKLTDSGRTALHLATLTGKLKMVEELVELLSEEDLQVLDNNHETALMLAAGVGATRIAECMIKKNSKLVTVPGKDDLPVIVACNNGHKDTARYLYSITPFELLLPENGKYGSLLLHVSIFNEMFDISLDLLRRCPHLSTTRNHLGTTPLIELSGLCDLFPSGLRFVFWKRWIYSGIKVQLPAAQHSDVRITIPQNDHKHHGSIVIRALGPLRRLGSNLLQFFGLKQIYDTKLTHAFALEILHWMSEDISTIDDTKLGQSGVFDAFFSAIQYGIIEVVIEMLKANPNLLTVLNTNRRGILQSAVQHRQEKIFSLIYVLDTRKYMLISGIDEWKNNILHIAAILAPPDRLAHISGAALQMQRELQWYKEVESIVNPLSKEYTNSSNEKPSQIFSDTHKQLVSDGEQWMKETATSCTVVGALIITIMFTAAFTVPGVWMFLGVLTSRYAEDDFIKSLPTKLIIGLSTLFISIAAMMVAFCATLIIMLKGEMKLVIPITLLASIPVTLFILLQFPLLVEIFVSTYGPGIFDRKMKNCSLFIKGIKVQLPAAQHSDVRITIPQNDHKHHGSIVIRALGPLRRLGSNLLQFFGLKQIYDTKLTHAFALEILHWMSEDISTIDDTKLGQSGVFDAFFSAIQYGIIEVVIEMLKANPNLLTVLNTNRRGILQSAVQHRQEKIFSLIYVLDTRKYMLISGIDEWKNNILHIAAILAPPDRLAHISGAALQMQRELQWYKEVESIVNPLSKEYTNSSNEKPSQIFSDTHKQLVSDGEQWMKETATSCTVVGALIITIMFTAAFTVPGGNVQDTGFPLFLHKKSFMVFIISDAISLFASSTSVWMFLGVLTSRYAEDDFIKYLPTKLIIGLSTLFISIAAMMVAFCATLIIMLKGEMKLVIPITLLASIPVTLFILLQFPLLVEIFVSTYGPGIFDRKMKNWY
ncbi:hypothetical protein GH714_005925 [Hevea brasiliensis]|uniref:Uncharacterized protein n=1 Tax=Hevea brasiliensis TaxID=3981 RepID=A0A6A6MZ06_HEVBR|nr:hypothetical protein GH714_005925 [Hevea brasiliensis]